MPAVGHTSVLELTNPDSGTALADVTVLGGSGVVDAPRLRGHLGARWQHASGSTSVRSSRSAGDLALDVQTVRGRLGATVLDRYDRVGSSALTQDWLAGQAEPSTDNLLLGLAPGKGRRTLVVANAGDDEVRAQVRIVTGDSIFAPEDVARGADRARGGAPSDLVVGPGVGACGRRHRSVGDVDPGRSPRRCARSSDGDLSHTVADAPMSGRRHDAPARRRGGQDPDGRPVRPEPARSPSCRAPPPAKSSRATTVEVAPDQGATVTLPLLRSWSP